jgi:hypothetical protein
MTKDKAEGAQKNDKKKGKDRFTYAAIFALLFIVAAIPAWMYASENLFRKPPSIRDYCGANGFLDVYPCRDGSFQAVRENYTEGFTIVRPDGSRFPCPFTLPQYQQGDCIEYSTGGMCGYMGDICGRENPCVSGADCSGGKTCGNWTCA